MDLRERGLRNPVRHPWEVARLHAVRTMLRTFRLQGEKIDLLDVGCGDGYLCLELSRTMAFSSVTAIDTGLSDDDAAEMTMRGNGPVFRNRYQALTPNGYNLVLLLDVLEHVREDREFLREISSMYLAGNGRLLVSAPAFPSLFGPHDRFLGHFRRYRLAALRDAVGRAGLECLESGYLFFSLLPLRFLSSVPARIFRGREAERTGVGAWRGGRYLSAIAAGVLRADFATAFFLNGLGVRIPGLSVWALCKRPR